MRKPSRPNIAFAGLTAAGKTTHAKILAEQLGYEWKAATAIITDLLGIKNDPEQVWFTDYTRIEKAREDDQIDIELERRIRALAKSRDGFILDTWAMAYIYEGPLIRVWIESDEDSRVRKCYVSHGEMKMHELDQCRRLIREKDASARSKFRKRLHFDLFTDMSRYDALLCNSNLITEPTEHCSRIGIRTFTPVMHDVVCYLVNQAFHTTPKVSIQHLQTTYGDMVLHVNERPWSFI